MKNNKTKPHAAAFKQVRQDHRRELSEDYVELIADLIAEYGEARGSDVAKRLGVANATVVKTLKRLADAGLIYKEPYRAIHLTELGQEMAKKGRDRHMIVEAFLRALGVDEESAHRDAEGIEHHVSNSTLTAMVNFLNQKDK